MPHPQVAALDAEIFERKRAIREHRTKLQEAAEARRRLIAQIEQFGIQVVQVDEAGEAGQGVEETHGRCTAGSGSHRGT